MHLLHKFKIDAKAGEPVEYLSGGQQQRAAIARALINDPTVIIPDEPTAHLDSALSEQFMAILAELKAEQKTIVLASHDPLVAESESVDRVIELRDGTLVEEG